MFREKGTVETLRQAERDMVYELRRFYRFRQEFIIEISRTFYRLILRQGSIRNDYNNYLSLLKAKERAEDLSRDRLSKLELDQTEQALLQSKSRYLISIQSYQQALNEFKLRLDIMDQPIRFDKKAMDKLIEQGVNLLTITSDAAYRLGLKHRLDILNTIDQFEDAKRKLAQAADALNIDLDLSVGATVSSKDKDQYLNFDMNKWTGRFSLTFKLSLDKHKERNAYRKALIHFEQAIRDLGQGLDKLKRDIRIVLRNLEKTHQRYGIQLMAVELAERQVENVNTLLKAGRANTRDLLEAENALISAKNTLIDNLVTYHLERLELLGSMGLMDYRDGKIISLLDKEHEEAGNLEDDEKLITPSELFDSGT